jgi:hypothetical protein
MVRFGVTYCPQGNTEGLQDQPNPDPMWSLLTLGAWLYPRPLLDVSYHEVNRNHTSNPGILVTSSCEFGHFGSPPWGFASDLLMGLGSRSMMTR